MKNVIWNIFIAIVILITITGCSQTQTTSNKQQNKASNYPQRPITVVVPWGTGGGSDQMARQLTLAAKAANGTKFVIQNMPGAGGLTGLNFVMDQPADGYTLYQVVTDQVIQMASGETDLTLDDIEPVFLPQDIISFLYIETKEDRFTNFEELIEYAKQNDGQVSVGTVGLNSYDAVMLASIENKYGFKFKNVPFNNPSERYAALAGGFIDVLFEQYAEVSSFVDSGQYKPIVVFNEEKLTKFPDTPPIVDFGIDETTGYYRGIWAKKGTPEEVLNFLSDTFQQAVQTDEWNKFNETQYAKNNSYLDRKSFSDKLDNIYLRFSSVFKTN